MEEAVPEEVPDLTDRLNKHSLLLFLTDWTLDRWVALETDTFTFMLAK